MMCLRMFTKIYDMINKDMFDFSKYPKNSNFSHATNKKNTW